MTHVSLELISSSKVVLLQQRYVLSFNLKSGSTIYGELTHAGDGVGGGAGGGAGDKPKTRTSATHLV